MQKYRIAFQGEMSAKKKNKAGKVLENDWVSETLSQGRSRKVSQMRSYLNKDLEKVKT